ncbi:AGE family epimerase/isomerase [Sphingobacterium spiritivorum]|uniref:AGE family epimerase/isomerase n=1 Tax=Sphingobacterium spiritivorum TaxID=258 RepID=UPI003DA2F80B
MKIYSDIYKNELLEQVIPFWEKYSIDRECGGYFTCLDRQGNVFDQDKFMWLQGRQVWMFSFLYQHCEQKQEWLDIALHGAAFMEEYGRDVEGNWYFSLNREGKPLVQPYNIFSDCFATMGFSALYKATGNTTYSAIAKQTFEQILKRRTDTKGVYNKIYPGTRDLRNFSLPMILSNLALEMEELLDKQVVEQLLDEIIHEVMEVFYNEERGIIFENVNPDGSFSNSFEGRLLNPGHTLEAMWFIMDLAVRKGDRSLIDKALEIALKALEYGWDKEYEGIFYFLDSEGHPPQQLEWDQKLWWVHLEALVCMAKAWKLTGDKRAKAWFVKLHDYSWEKFRDAEYGEWFGYLNRRGEVLLPLKGGKWKGCFHAPRALWQIYQTLA